MSNIADAAKKSISELLGSNSQHEIIVPDYQRSYSWTKSEVSTFWADLTAFDERFPGEAILGEEYFLGSIVAVRRDRELGLIDGQQRLATATLLLGAIRDGLGQLSPVSADRIQRDYIRTEASFAQGHRYSITLNAYDRNFFRNRVQDYPRPDTELPQRFASHSLILGASRLFADELEGVLEELQSADERIAYLERLKDVVAHRLTLVLVSAEEEDDATEVRFSRTVHDDCSFGPTKSRRSRVVSLPAWIVPEIRNRLATSDGPLIFPAPSGKPLPVRRFSARYWRPAAKRSGFADVTPHQLRHLHATQLIELGRPITEVAARLGHRNSRVTMEVYARWIQPDDSGAAAVVPNYSATVRAVGD